MGVDDWAWKKGQTYGTILVDLERRTVADLLPQRSAEQLSEWLRQHPEVEVITRDRLGLYAGGARRTASATGCRPLSSVAESARGGRKRTGSTTSTIGLTASGTKGPECREDRAGAGFRFSCRSRSANPQETAGGGTVERQERAVCEGPNSTFKRPARERHCARDRSWTPTCRQVDSLHPTTDQERDGTETNLAQILCRSPTTSVGGRLSRGSSIADRNPRARLSRMLFELSEISCSLASP